MMTMIRRSWLYVPIRAASVASLLAVPWAVGAQQTVTMKIAGEAITEVTITVDGNHDPVGGADSGSTKRQTPITLDVLANDTDADGDTLCVKGVDPYEGGDAVINPDCTVTFTPPAGFPPTSADAQIRFRYIVADRLTECGCAPVPPPLPPAPTP